MKESDSSFREAPTRRGSDARRAIDVPVQLLRDQRGVYGIGFRNDTTPKPWLCCAALMQFRGLLFSGRIALRARCRMDTRLLRRCKRSSGASGTGFSGTRPKSCLGN